MESVEYKNASFTIWDIGGQQKVITGLLSYHTIRLKAYIVKMTQPIIVSRSVMSHDSHLCISLVIHCILSSNCLMQIRPLWKHYFHNTNGLIFVVDSSDRQRIIEARNELHNVISDVSLLVM